VFIVIKMSSQVKVFKNNFNLKANGKSLDLSSPKVMGILNVTPDSFFPASRIKNHAKLLHLAEKMLDGGATIIDIGAVSTRPGSSPLTEEVELKRLLPALRLLRATFPEVFISVDTFRAHVALAAFECGADIINDVYAGNFDENMFNVVASTKLPYVMMHMKGNPSYMQINPKYKNVVLEVKSFLRTQIKKAELAGIKQIIVDPGFGFGKILSDNYLLLKNLKDFSKLGKPVLVGLSRKSMINKVLNIKANSALNGTTVINTVALINGASILRVHDAKQAKQAVSLINFYKSV
jgi:dihydropteroate synthase